MGLSEHPGVQGPVVAACFNESIMQPWYDELFNLAVKKRELTGLILFEEAEFPLATMFSAKVELMLNFSML